MAVLGPQTCELQIEGKWRLVSLDEAVSCYAGSGKALPSFPWTGFDQRCIQRPQLWQDDETLEGTQRLSTQAGDVLRHGVATSTGAHLRSGSAPPPDLITGWRGLVAR